MQTTTQPACIDSSFITSHQQWTVSLVRREKAANSQHVFILVQGINQFGTGELRRYDLVVHKSREGFADIMINARSGAALANLFSAFVALVKLGAEGDKLYHKTWSISLAEANQLHTAITNEKQGIDSNTLVIAYYVLGNKSVSNSVNGESCYSWAKKKLKNLGNPTIDIPDCVSDIIVELPSLYLNDDEPTSGMACLLL